MEAQQLLVLYCTVLRSSSTVSNIRNAVSIDWTVEANRAGNVQGTQRSDLAMGKQIIIR